MTITNNDEFLDIFENRLKEYTGAPYVVLTDRCTNAIFLSLWYKQKYEKQYEKSTLNIEITPYTYMSVPMTIKNFFGSVSFNNNKWNKWYCVFDNIIDSAVYFDEDMYISGSIMCLSFHQKKRLNIGKGGAILLDDKKAYEVLKKLCYDGRTRYLNSVDEVHSDSDIICGFHMNMSPDEASKGILLLNQIHNTPKKFGTWKDYPDLRKLNCF